MYLAAAAFDPDSYPAQEFSLQMHKYLSEIAKLLGLELKIGKFLFYANII